jgi:hypothetical protein
MNNGGVYRSKKIHDSDARVFFQVPLFPKDEKGVSVAAIIKHPNIL